MGIVKSIIGLTYLEPLTNQNAIKLFAFRPRSIDDCTVYVLLSIFFLLLATFSWVLGVYGLGQALLILSASIFVMSLAAKDCYKFSIFDSNDENGQWAWIHNEDETAWPKLLQNKGDKVGRVIRRLGKATKLNAELDAKDTWASKVDSIPATTRG